MQQDRIEANIKGLKNGQPKWIIGPRWTVRMKDEISSEEQKNQNTCHFSIQLAERQPMGRWAAIHGSTGCINIQKHNYIANYISRIY